MSKQLDCSKDPRMLFRLKNIGINRLQLSVTILFVSSSLINNKDKIILLTWLRTPFFNNFINLAKDSISSLESI